MEILLVVVVALVVFGPKRLPELSRSVGKGLREFKGSVSGAGDALVDSDEAPVRVKSGADREA